MVANGFQGHAGPGVAGAQSTRCRGTSGDDQTRKANKMDTMLTLTRGRIWTMFIGPALILLALAGCSSNVSPQPRTFHVQIQNAQARSVCCDRNGSAGRAWFRCSSCLEK